MRVDHRFVVELFRRGGEPVGHAEISPDWTPAVECARLAGLRRLGVWVPDASAEGPLEPLWDDHRGEPYTRAFRVHLAAPDMPAWSEDFPVIYVADLARAASAPLVERGVLASGDEVVYRVLAYRRPDPPPEPEADLFTSVEVPVPLPMRDLSLDGLLQRSVPGGDTQVGDHDVFLPDDVLNEAVALTTAAGDVETGGVLIGHIGHDATGHDIAVEVTAMIPARHTAGTATKLTFTSETWTDVRHALCLRARDELILGWFHSHPQLAWCREKGCSPEAQRQCASARGFFSPEDAALHRTLFPRAYSVALVMTLSINGVRSRLFGWRAGRIQPRGYRLVNRLTTGDRIHATAATA